MLVEYFIQQSGKIYQQSGKFWNKVEKCGNKFYIFELLKLKLIIYCDKSIRTIQL